MTTESAAPIGPDRDRTVRRLQRLARLLDSAFRLPGGYRIGFDGLLGLIPGIGDAAGAGLSAYIVIQAARLGVPAPSLLRMTWNVLLETVVGLIPVLGDWFDFAWKANLRNLRLIEAHLEKQPGPRTPDRTPDTH